VSNTNADAESLLSFQHLLVQFKTNIRSAFLSNSALRQSVQRHWHIPAMQPHPRVPLEHTLICLFRQCHNRHLLLLRDWVREWQIEDSVNWRFNKQGKRETGKL